LVIPNRKPIDQIELNCHLSGFFGADFQMIVGIDLGTTNSAVGIWRDGKAELIPNSVGDLITPSAVSVDDKGTVLVGVAARERQPIDPDNSAVGFKRLIGTEQQLKLRGKFYKPEDLSALVLRSLKADVEAHIGEAVTEAVITVPAYFNDKQRRATQRAADMAGFKKSRLLNEPTAAALGYGIHELDQEEPFLVFDLGGGTFDVSIVEIFDGIIEVRSTAGDPRLGGIDFNQALALDMLKKFGDELMADRDLPGFQSIMLEAAERCRRALSDSGEASFRVVWKEKVYETQITTAAFEESVAPLITRLKEPVLRSLRDGGLRAEMLSEVIMVGGATRMPVVRQAVTRLFGRFPNHSLHPDHAVALGAAVQAGLLGKDAALDEIRMTDVCPFTLGLDTTERDQFGTLHAGVFAPIIERNRTIPASKEQEFSTLEDNQPLVNFGVYQGESRNVAENIKLGQLSIKVPRKPAGEVAIKCRFSYDVSGLLEVDITIPMTGETKQYLFGNDMLDDDELAKRRKILEKLKVHPRDDVVNAALLARATRCYESLIGDERNYVGQMILTFEGALQKQDGRLIEQVRGDVSSALDEIEGERYL
tara:strand:+ start:1045 stop:2823 length:1779 start_codon:yes stop_codon:yes gene_type:complete